MIVSIFHRWNQMTGLVPPWMWCGLMTGRNHGQFCSSPMQQWLIRDSTQKQEYTSKSSMQKAPWKNFTWHASELWEQVLLTWDHLRLSNLDPSFLVHKLPWKFTGALNRRTRKQSIANSESWTCERYFFQFNCHLQSIPKLSYATNFKIRDVLKKIGN